jgi:hypothetical protein
MKNVPENELFSAYLDGELTAGEQAQVERLLATSPAARQLLDELRAVSATLQALPAYKLDVDLTPQILRAAERQMLGQPADAADASSERETESGPAVAWKVVARRVLTPRNVAWPMITVAVALLVMVFSNQRHERKAADREIARAPSAEAPEPRREPRREPSNASIHAPATAEGQGEDAFRPPREEAKLRDREPAVSNLKAETWKAGPDGRAVEKTKGTGVAPGEPAADVIVGKPAAGVQPSAPLAEHEKDEHSFRKAGEPGTPQEGVIAGKGGVRTGPNGAYGAGRGSPGLRAMGAGGGHGGGSPGSPPGAGPPSQNAVVAREVPRADRGVERTMVVFCDVSPEAAQSRTFDRLIASQQIVWQPPAQEGRVLAVDKLRKTDPSRPKRAEGLAASADSKRQDDETREQDSAEELDFVMVEATPSQIEATLASLRAQPQDFVSVCVAPAPGVAVQEELSRYNRGYAVEQSSHRRGAMAKALAGEAKGDAAKDAAKAMEASKPTAPAAATGAAPPSAPASVARSAPEPPDGVPGVGWAQRQRLLLPPNVRQEIRLEGKPQASKKSSASAAPSVQPAPATAPPPGSEMAVQQRAAPLDRHDTKVTDGGQASGKGLQEELPAAKSPVPRQGEKQEAPATGSSLGRPAKQHLAMGAGPSDQAAPMCRVLFVLRVIRPDAADAGGDVASKAAQTAASRASGSLKAPAVEAGKIDAAATKADAMPAERAKK